MNYLILVFILICIMHSIQEHIDSCATKSRSDVVILTLTLYSWLEIAKQGLNGVNTCFILKQLTVLTKLYYSSRMNTYTEIHLKTFTNTVLCWTGNKIIVLTLSIGGLKHVFLAFQFDSQLSNFPALDKVIKDLGGQSTLQEKNCESNFSFYFK